MLDQAGRRTLAAVLALAGTGVAGYLAAVQMDAIGHAWDPVFGDGTDTVINSSVANLLPFPDALLGMLGYLVEAVLVLYAGTAPGRSRRWPGLLLEAEAIAFALTGVGLVAVQAFVVHAWCSWCLASAVVSWAILAVTVGLRRSPAPHRSPR
ncbi:MAG TPA: vitamin K epoxide reductase family protein [Nocardioides sp.]|nr:vitamin K epoxide reductase family protein [Nocardioides sp.]